MQPNTEPGWRVYAASVTGRRNLELGQPGQDAGQFTVAGDSLIGIVCDGAGSARAGRTGAEYIARELGTELARAVAADARVPDAGVVTDALDPVRTRLAALADAQGLTLADHACTLVGCIVRPAGGCFFHIGDGYAIWRAADGTNTVSLPENGEYADETYFVTDEDWQARLRLTALPAVAPGVLVGLLSDGTAPFAINRERSGFYGPFIDPVAAFLARANAAEGDAALQQLLGSARASAISGDDKTLLLAFAG